MSCVIFSQPHRSWGELPCEFQVPEFPQKQIFLTFLALVSLCTSPPHLDENFSSGGPLSQQLLQWLPEFHFYSLIDFLPAIYILPWGFLTHT